MLNRNPVAARLALLLWTALAAASALAQDAAPPADAAAAALPSLPAPLGVPKPGPSNSAPYAPQPILPGGVVIALYPPDSHYLNTNRIREAEQYSMTPGVPGRTQILNGG